MEKQKEGKIKQTTVDKKKKKWVTFLSCTFFISVIMWEVAKMHENIWGKQIFNIGELWWDIVEL